MAKVEIFHRMPKRNIKEVVFESRFIAEALHRMAIYKRNWTQNDEQFHEIKVNRKVRDFSELKDKYKNEMHHFSREEKRREMEHL